MAQSDQDFGRLNAKAPAELSRFTFLIGKWQCEANLMLANGTWQTFKAAWLGRYILDGYAIADEYRMLGPSGDLIVLGMNLRTYDAIKRTWNIRWLNGSLETGRISCRSNWAELRSMAHLSSRPSKNRLPVTYTWRGEKSDDGKSWSEFMIVEAVREK